MVADQKRSIRWKMTAEYSLFMVRWFEISRFCEFNRDVSENRITLEVSPFDLLGLIFPPRNVNILTCPGTPSTVSCNELSSNIAQLRFYHIGPEWQRVFPLIQVNPENVMDVENGLGFFGAYRQ